MKHKKILYNIVEATVLFAQLCLKWKNVNLKKLPPNDNKQIANYDDVYMIEYSEMI